MAHISKYKACSLGHLLEHYDRSSLTPTENIDLNKSSQNYNLAKDVQPMQQLDFIHKRLSEVKIQKRKDVNVMCDWIVTLPKDLPKDKETHFFKETYNFLSKKYGKDNVISAYVHKDEVTPHIHFAFLPIVPDKKKGGYKVSAKECITLASLKTFHTELQTHLEDCLQMPVNVLNDATKNGNKAISELKRGTALKQFNELKEGIKMTQEQMLQVQAMGNVIKKHDLMPEYQKEFNKLKSIILNKTKER